MEKQKNIYLKNLTVKSNLINRQFDNKQYDISSSNYLFNLTFKLVKT
jgi:hypothetical protein